MTIYDIAGLTRGASTGAGLGNAFLSHIRAVDAIFEVVRCFDDAEIIHVEGDVDPVRDLNIISEELRLKDIEFVEKALENLQKQTKRGGQTLEMKKLREDEATVAKVLQWLKDGKDVRQGDWNPKEVRFHLSLLIPSFAVHDEQEHCSNLTQLVERPIVSRWGCLEITSILISFPSRLTFLPSLDCDSTLTSDHRSR